MSEILGGSDGEILDGSGGLTIDGLLKDMGILPGKPQKSPEPPTRQERVLVGLSYVLEFVAFVLLFTSFISLGLTIVGVLGMITFGSFLQIGMLNSSAVAIAGGISTSAIMSAAISIRKFAQDARAPSAVKKMMKAAGLKF
jgi:hypothetical protein